MTNLSRVSELIVCLCLSISLVEARPPQQGGPVKPPLRPNTDILRDNLDRVAASPERILEILNQEAGLMVELKQLLAEDAGMYGQLLEESDLTDVAIADRLHEDLHVRALATKLLRRYGYLLPRLNPDSDMATEHALELRERSQELERARAARS